MRLNSIYRKKIFDILDGSLLTSANFDVEFEAECLVKIICKQNDSYYYKAIEPSFQVTCSPGDVLDGETTNHPHFDSSLTVLSKWVKRVEDNLEADAVLYGDVQDFVIQAEAYILNLEDPKLPIPEKDREAWIEKLDELEQECLRIIEVQKRSEKDAENLKAEIARLQAKIGSMPAATWLRSVGGRFRDYYSKAKSNPKVQAFLLWGAEKATEKLIQQISS